MQNNTPHNNQFVKILNDEGTGGFISPIAKNEAWSWTVIDIKTSKNQTFQLDFQPNKYGSEGTQSDFTLYLTNRENKVFEKIPFNGKISIPANKEFFLVIVNTPDKYEGWETFDYKIKVSP